MEASSISSPGAAFEPGLTSSAGGAPPSSGVYRSKSTNSQHHNPQHRSGLESQQAAGQGIRRNASLTERFPGDMTHRPLDMLRRDARVADRGLGDSRRRRARIVETDTIDSLAATAPGGAYHLGGPYDATLASRNLIPMYSPVEAVRDSNIEALKATPREYIRDSLDRHMPLQGTATIPPGHRDMSGNVMDYREGTDLMREPDAPGGPYRRWHHVEYHPDDLKGKGEPSYTYEKNLKEDKDRRRLRSVSASGHQSGMELLSASERASFRRRRRDDVTSADEPTAEEPATETDPRASSNSTGRQNRLSEGLRRTLGSLRKKKAETGGDE